MIRIDTIEQWYELATTLRSEGRKPWATQYRATDPNGLHVWFWKSGEPDIEVVTYSIEVQDAISKYRNE